MGDGVMFERKRSRIVQLLLNIERGMRLNEREERMHASVRYDAYTCSIVVHQWTHLVLFANFGYNCTTYKEVEMAMRYFLRSICWKSKEMAEAIMKGEKLHEHSDKH